MGDNEFNSMTAVDQIANGDNLQIYKAIIPYLPVSLQKNCILFIKMMEMNNLLSYYSSPLSACSVHSSSKEPEEIMKELKNYGNDAQNQLLEQAINLLSTLKLYKTYHDLL